MLFVWGKYILLCTDFTQILYTKCYCPCNTIWGVSRTHGYTAAFMFHKPDKNHILYRASSLQQISVCPVTYILHMHTITHRWSKYVVYHHSHPCHPGKSKHRLLGSVASWISLFTCPLTLNGTQSSIPSSFSCSLNKTRSAILFVGFDPLPGTTPVEGPSKNWSPAVAVAVDSSRRWMFRALTGDMVHMYRGSCSSTCRNSKILSICRGEYV